MENTNDYDPTTGLQISSTPQAQSSFEPLAMVPVEDQGEISPEKQQ